MFDDDLLHAIGGLAHGGLSFLLSLNFALATGDARRKWRAQPVRGTGEHDTTWRLDVTLATSYVNAR
jgi:hypothetical protein